MEDITARGAFDGMKFPNGDDVEKALIFEDENIVMTNNISRTQDSAEDIKNAVEDIRNTADFDGQLILDDDVVGPADEYKALHLGEGEKRLDDLCGTREACRQVCYDGVDQRVSGVELKSDFAASGRDIDLAGVKIESTAMEDVIKMSVGKDMDNSVIEGEINFPESGEDTQVEDVVSDGTQGKSCNKDGIGEISQPETNNLSSSDDVSC